jgi:hypothetical protein
LSIRYSQSSLGLQLVAGGWWLVARSQFFFTANGLLETTAANYKLSFYGP